MFNITNPLIKVVVLIVGATVFISLFVSLLGYLNLGGSMMSTYKIPSYTTNDLEMQPGMVAPMPSYYYQPWWYDILTSSTFWVVFIIIAAAVVIFKKRNTLAPNVVTIHPISMVFSILLTLALLILFNKIWNDLATFVSLNQYSSTASEKLATLFMRTLFIVSTLVTMFLLHFAFQDRKNYQVLVLPYFVVSLLFSAVLLFNTAEYTFSNLGSIGVYIVLIFFIGVFTSLLFFAQKWHHPESTNNQVSTKT